MAAYVKNTVEPNPESRNVHTAQGSQPSVKLSPTHETDSAERARRWELAERTQACVIYCRGEIPSWTRNYSPLGDLHFIRSMNVPEQIAFVTEITAAGVTDFVEFGGKVLAPMVKRSVPDAQATSLISMDDIEAIAKSL